MIFLNLSSRISGDHSRPGIPQERDQQVGWASPRLHLPHGRDERLEVRRRQLAPADRRNAIPKTFQWLTTFLSVNVKLFYTFWKINDFCLFYSYDIIV